MSAEVWAITSAYVTPRCVAWNDIASLVWTTNLGERGDLDVYILQRCESSDGVNWGEWNWSSGTSTSESMTIYAFHVTGFGTRETLNLAVTPPDTLGHFYKYRIKSRYSFKSAQDGATYESEWVETNTLRHGAVTVKPWTDDPLVAGETSIKAVHMTELQERANVLRAYYAAAEAAFTPAVAEITSLALWKQQVEEVRAALDEINMQTVDWLEIPVNCPRADVMMQLRAVIDSL